MRSLGLKDKTVVITGATLGIGRALVKAFAQEGARVFFCGLEEDKGEELCGEFGGQVDFTPVDLTRQDEIIRWFSHIREQTEHLDCLINNAGKDSRIPLEEITVEQWDWFYQLNIRAYFLCAKEASPLLGEGSSIINMGSVTFQLGYAPMSAYVSTKGAVVGFSRSLARELGPRHIRVNTLSPGWTMTERQLAEHVDDQTKEFLKEVQCDPSPIQPSEIADIALFLASPLSAAITGQNICADRGWIHH